MLKRVDNKKSKIQKIFIVLLIIVLGFILRMYALENLETDFDERTYVPVAKKFADSVKNGVPSKIITNRKNLEHPAHVKILFGVAIFVSDKLGIDMEDFYVQRDLSRFVNIFFSLLHILLITVINPVGGLLMAISSWEIKYTTEALLDGIATFYATVGILAFIRSNSKFNRYFIISAVAMGAAFASKYISATTALTILPFLIMNNRKNIKNIFIYGIISFSVFFILNPAIWINTFTSLKNSLLFHGSYVQGFEVRNSHFPFYQQLCWLSSSVDRFSKGILIKVDLFILLAGFFGLKKLYSYNKILWTWFIVNFVFLMIYPTKWPQYTTIFIPVLSISAGLYLKEIIVRAKDWINENILRNIDRKIGWIWITVAICAVAIMIIGIVFFIIAVENGKTNDKIRETFSRLSIIIVVLGLISSFFTIVQTIQNMKNNIKLKYKNLGLAYAYIFPAILGMVVLVLFPLSFGFFISFTDYSFNVDFSKISFIGFENYIYLIFWEGPRFWNIAFVTMWWTLFSLIFALGIGLIIALILGREKMQFRNLYKMVFIIPWAIPVYLMAFMWNAILMKDFGLVNKVLAPIYEFFGIEKFNWMYDKFIDLAGLKNIPVIGDVLYTTIGIHGKLISLPFFATLVLNIWITFPFFMVVSMGALKTISADLYEAADIDGASTWQQFKYITVPLLKPILMPAIVLDIVWTFNQFTLIYLMETDMTILSVNSYYIFKEGYYAFSAAYSLISFGILILFIQIVKKIFKVKKLFI